jgi:hypothetical protein
MTDQVKKINDEQNNSAEWLRSFRGCEHYGDVEAKETIESLDILASILLENAAQKLRSNSISINIDNQEQTEPLAA